MSTRASEGLVRRAVTGALAGAVLGLVAWLGAVFALKRELPWWQGLLLVLGGMVACAVGQLLARGIVGAALGLAIGFVVGDVLAGPNEKPRAAVVGERAVLKGPTLDGKTFDVAELRGKVVLVDFWATWCGPCRKEVPNLRALHERYHDQGFQIVGVSLDNSRPLLVHFVEAEEMNWPQIFVQRDRDGQNPIARRYGVDAIPHTLLLDREGRIVASALRGSHLERAVTNVLAGRPPDAVEPGRLPRWLTVWGLVLAGWLAGMLVESRFRASERAPQEPRP
jgi:thiol-disulfide isomerase/thioredoxin